MDKYVKLAEESLNRVSNDYSHETCAIKGIGYAILALAEAIRQNGNANNNYYDKH